MDLKAVEDRQIFITTAEDLLVQGMNGVAMELAEERLKAYPADLDALVVICRCWVAMGRVAEAREAFARVEDALTVLANLYRDMGSLFIKRNMREEGMALLEKARVLLPGENMPHSPLLGGEESTDTAPWSIHPDDHHDAETGGDVLPSDFQTLTVAELYTRQGHLTEASQVLRAVLLKEPDNERARALLEEVEGRLQRSEEDVVLKRREALVVELQRWLANIERIRRN
ncbi:MAG: tetratricopeptide repeat protein [Syntrophales bacterium]|nr:tetratricopeptide repeat protein [Syntrophales bacterium]